jgi:hypothetical protein
MVLALMSRPHRAHVCCPLLFNVCIQPTTMKGTMLWYIKNLEQGASLFGNINNILSLKLNIKIVDIVMRKFIAHKKI